MHKDRYHKKSYHTPDKLIIDLDAPKFLMIIISVFAFFVIPAQIISFYQSNSSKQPVNDVVVAEAEEPVEENPAQESPARVAGASTEVTGESSGSSFNLSNRSTQFAMLGIFFISVSFISIGYLFFFDKREPVQKSNYY